MKGKKVWLTVVLAAALAAVEAATGVGLVPPVILDVVQAVGGLLQPGLGV